MMLLKNISNIFYKKPQFLNPEKVIDEAKLKEGALVVDYGAGVGFWTLALSKKVGDKGKVYSLSSNADFISLINKKAELEGARNVETKFINLDEGKIKLDQKVDLVLMSNVLHVTKSPDLMIQNAKDLIKKDGQVLIIDFMKLKSIFGPPIQYRLSEEEVLTKADKAGLHFQCTVDTGWYHYGLLFGLEGKGSKSQNIKKEG